MLFENLIIQLSIFSILNLLVFLNSAIISIYLLKYKLKSWIKFALTSFLVFTLQVFLSQIILGIFGILNYENIWIINFILTSLGLFFLGEKVFKKTEFPKISKVEIIPFLLIFSPFIIILILRYYNALFQIPLEYDNVAYHLPFAVEWYKTKSLLGIYYNAFAGPLGYYPSNFELFDLWVILPFGKDYLVNLINFPIFLLLIVAIYKVGRNLNLSSNLALLSSAFFIYMPQIFLQMGVPLVDLFFSLTFIVSIYFLQEFFKSKSFRDILLFGISLGFFMGTKYLGIPYSFPLILAGGTMASIVFKVREIKFLISIFLLALGSFLGGTFWYIRNWVESGNPIFPVDISFFGKKIFDGYYGLSERIFNSSLIKNINSFESLKNFLEGFFLMSGAQVILFIAVIIFLVFLFFKYLSEFCRNKKENFSGLCISGILLLSLLFYFYFYFKAPYTYNNLIPNVRYSMMFLILSSISTGFIASKIKKIKIPIYILSFFIFSFNLLFLILNSPLKNNSNEKMIIDYKIIFEYPKIITLYLLLCLFLIFSFLFLILIKNNKKHIYLFLFSILTTITIFSFLINESIPKREDKRKYYSKIWYASDSNNFKYDLIKAAQWMDENTHSKKIAYSGFNFHYHFFGRDLQRELDYVNINECLNCRYSDFKNSKESIRRNPDYESWIKNIKSMKKEYLVLANLETDGVKMWEHNWVKNNPDKFQQVFQSGEISVYKIIN